MENTLKDQVLNRPSTETIEVTEIRTSFSDLDENVQLAVKCAADKKAVNTVVLDLRAIASFTEFFVITGGSNQRQVQAIGDEIQEQLKKRLGDRPVRIEGYNSAEWVLMDYGDFVVHIFDQKSRDFYDLERLWRDAYKVELPSDL
jgi:ribosome-associated protein